MRPPHVLWLALLLATAAGKPRGLPPRAPGPATTTPPSPDWADSCASAVTLPPDVSPSPAALSRASVVGTSAYLLAVTWPAGGAAGAGRGGDVEADPSSPQLRAAQRARAAARWAPLAAAGAVLLWCIGGQGLVAALKQLLGDSNCHRRGYANSISGHAHWYVFLLAALPFVGRDASAAAPSEPQRPLVPLGEPAVNRRPLSGGGGAAAARRTAAAAAAYGVVALAALVDFRRTVEHGFHSPRQLVYGIGFGLCCVALWRAARRALAPPPDAGAAGAAAAAVRWVAASAVWAAAGVTAGCAAGGLPRVRAAGGWAGCALPLLLLAGAAAGWWRRGTLRRWGTEWSVLLRRRSVRALWAPTPRTDVL
eukprot:TRINITY_DN31998_c0_g1_i2.p1 TRINITY_DN31998_c0_g1~~TRINITY_DN31998_c0_g1_i2.p1  ORF type:complete len:390 (+),score=78.91 TRINITY_DN31998_c0_g1_i2:73-1170(+)